MAVTAYKYVKADYHAWSGDIDWVNDTIQAGILASSYTPDQDADEFWDDVSADEVAGTGYTAVGASGYTLASKTLTTVGATNKTVADAADLSWTSSTITGRYVVLVKWTGTASTSPVIGYVDLGTDQVSSASTWSITWASGGIFDVTAA